MLEQLEKGKKVVGLKQSIRAIESKEAKIAFVAGDAEERIIKKVKDACTANSIEFVLVDNMKQLGKYCGIEVGAASACLLK